MVYGEYMERRKRLNFCRPFNGTKGRSAGESLRRGARGAIRTSLYTSRLRAAEGASGKQAFGSVSGASEHWGAAPPPYCCARASPQLNRTQHNTRLAVPNGMTVRLFMVLLSHAQPRGPGGVYF